jgi:hypothetical protein
VSAGRLLYAGIVTAALACAVPVAADAEEAPLVGGEQLSVGMYWGLYEQQGSQVQDSIGFVGTPMPLLLRLRDNGEHRLFVLVEHRVPGGPYCAETPAQVEDVSVELTATEGDPTIPGPEYSETYVWTPTEPGEYALCTYLDTAATAHPVSINFLKLTADPAPGQLSLTVAPEAQGSEATVSVEGKAVVTSKVTVSVQEQGLPCTLPDGQLAGQQLLESLGYAGSGSNRGAVGPGPFTASYTFTASKSGLYEACAYLTPEPTETMYFGRPYEVGSVDFSTQEALVKLAAGQPAGAPAPTPAPTLSDVGVTNSRFRAASSRANLARRAPRGTAFRFAVSEPSIVTIAIDRVLPGAVRGHACVLVTAARRKEHPERCNRIIAVGSITHRQPTAGAGAVSFSGLLGKRKLATGFYVGSVSAHNASGRSGSVAVRFSVAP